MTNREFYKEQILDVVCDGWDNFAFNKYENRIIACDSCNCDFCAFDSNTVKCREMRKRWAKSKYVEKSELTENEKAFLNLIDSKFKFIARDKTGRLVIYKTKPIKEKGCLFWSAKVFDSYSISNILGYECFSFIRWEDREPWSIEALKKLKVRKEDEENDN